LVKSVLAGLNSQSNSIKDRIEVEKQLNQNGEGLLS